MRKPIGSRAAAAGLLAVCVAAGSHAAPHPPGLGFDEVFTGRGEPARLHFRASYLAGGDRHSMEAWRSGSSRLRRRADDAVDNFVVQPAGDTGWRMTVLDLRRKIRSDVDRDSLVRLGHLADWFSLAHGVARPVGGYTLRPVPAPHALPVKPLSSCRWYELAQAGRSSIICWSTALRLPLLIVENSSVQWQVTQVDRNVPDDVFTVHDEGFVRNDASADIRRD
ncbi:MAG: hypothetical protein JWM93_3299 [Frankiales bacterium]|nr:hypothetical protein [Frankiales bacterium]